MGVGAQPHRGTAARGAWPHTGCLGAHECTLGAWAAWGAWAHWLVLSGADRGPRPAPRGRTPRRRPSAVGRAARAVGRAPRVAIRGPSGLAKAVFFAKWRYGLWAWRYAARRSSLRYRDIAKSPLRKALALTGRAHSARREAPSRKEWVRGQLPRGKNAAGCYADTRFAAVFECLP
jgi:hypothetical protein